MPKHKHSGKELYQAHGMTDYADEADLLNVALFGCTAKSWLEENPELAKHNNIRDFASTAELTVLSNLETHNAELIKRCGRTILSFETDCAIPTPSFGRGRENQRIATI